MSEIFQHREVPSEFISRIVLSGAVRPTFISVSCLPTIEMHVVLNVANQAGADAGTPIWRPALLLVQGWPLECTKAVLREVTEMNAKGHRKRSQVVLVSGLSSEDIDAALRAASEVGAQVRELSLIGDTAILVPGLSAETLETVLYAAGGFGPDPLEPIERKALFLVRGWPFKSMEQVLRSVVRQAVAAERATRGDEPNWPMIDGPFVAASLADFHAGRFTVRDPMHAVLTGDLSSTHRICVAWGLSSEQIQVALVARDDLGAEVKVLAGEFVPSVFTDDLDPPTFG